MVAKSVKNAITAPVQAEMMYSFVGEVKGTLLAHTRNLCGAFVPVQVVDLAGYL
jgi:hypothetical protein